ncbi:E3 ubiquitin-protein ligase PUB22-like protein [Carex littledalei]|uniref:U-box domain-containing protein n=1 Tax=Carex littledalei TaxID=544730 RepID=A0A833RL39_9POAL|nr:E3 ubiquitin-protein ligase PUB22-like protein [Carex littledalei]
MEISPVEIPSYFLCPISLEIMRDPVILSTGMTYDRSSIERWIFSEKHQTCPATNQPITDPDLITPNHTLRRLIQAWCVTHASDGIERFPTPKPPINKSQIISLLEDAKKPHNTVISLRKLRGLILEGERNKRLVEECVEVMDYLVSLIKNYTLEDKINEGHLWSEEDVLESASSIATTTPCEEALNLLHSLKLSDKGLIRVLERNEGFMDILTAIMAKSNYQSRVYAVFLVKSLVQVMSPTRMILVRSELIQEIVRVVKDQVSSKAVKTALQVLCRLGPWGRNRVKVVEAGAVQLIIDMLLDERDKKACELMLFALEQLCRCAEGRSQFILHDAGIALVSKKIFRVSHNATESSVRILNLVAKYLATPVVLQEMVQLGVVAKLFMVLQMDCSTKAKEKAKEILSLHCRVWRASPCLSPQLKAYYPS